MKSWEQVSFFSWQIVRSVGYRKNNVPIVYLSGLEVEYIATTDVVKEGLWLLQLLKSLNFEIEEFTLFEDSIITIKYCYNEDNNKRAKIDELQESNE